MKFGGMLEQMVDCNMILTLPIEFKASSSQANNIEKETADMVEEIPTVVKLREEVDPESEDNHHNKHILGKITFKKPSRNMT